MKRIYLKDLIEDLGVKETRSVKAWCNKKGVPFYKDTKALYVLESEFLEKFTPSPADKLNKSPIIAAPKKIKVARFVPTSEAAIKLANKFSFL